MTNPDFSIHHPDFKEKMFFLVSGMIISVPFTLFVETISDQLLSKNLPQIISVAILVAIVAPIFEEFGKAYPLFYRHSETERSIMTLGFLTGLGFGIVEFIFYVFGAGASAASRLTALLFHATNTSIVAFGIAKKRTFSYYLIAVSLHFLNNFSASQESLWLRIGAPAVAISYGLAFILWLSAKEKVIDNL